MPSPRDEAYVNHKLRSITLELVYSSRLANVFQERVLQRKISNSSWPGELNVIVCFQFPQPASI